LNIDTIRFGNIEIEEEKVITIVEGMFGFPGRHRYIILEHKEGSPFRWFQCVDDPSLAFVIIDPEMFQPQYRAAVPKEHLLALGLQDPLQAAVFVVVNIASDHSMITANLEGPVVVNPEKMVGRQIVLSDSSYSTRHVICSREGERCSETG